MKNSIVCLVFALIVMTFTGCSGKRVETSGRGIKPLPAGTLSDTTIKKMLLKEYRLWKGAPHVMGGNTRKGVDCSGFVHQMFKRVLKINVPRSTQLLMSAGKRIKKSELRPGDIVLFKPPTFPRHVGIYTGGNKFIHTSKSKGVTLADLDNRYWKNCYYASRRLFLR